MTYRIIELTAAALMMTLGAGAAHAAAPATAPAAARPSAEPAAKPEKRYCVRTTITGSRMPRTVCRTRQAWLDEGFDPLARN